jgi:hypothetical protein
LLDISIVPPYMKCTCPWLLENLELTQFQSSCRDDEVILVSEEGSRFKVHQLIIARKSEKLESAIRFSRMNRSDNKGDTMLEMKVPIPARLLNAMIQHFYHGSVSFWPSFENQTDLCLFLLELMLVAEEFLCQDLMMEIEMRLLSSDPQCCFCWACCRAVRVDPSCPFSAQCLYCVDAKGCLLTESSIFHVLGLTEYIREPEYTLSLLPVNLITSSRMGCTESVWTGGSPTKALTVLKDCLEMTILRDFSSVRRFLVEYAGNFVDQNQEGEDGQSQKQVLLQMCLNDIPKSCLLGPVDQGPGSSKSRVLNRHECSRSGVVDRN